MTGIKSSDGSSNKGATTSATAAPASSSSSSSSTTVVQNKQRNLLITDCRDPFSFGFVGKYGINNSITVQQTPDEDVWPGGALWDLGVVLAETFVAVADAMNRHNFHGSANPSTNSGAKSGTTKTITRNPKKKQESQQQERQTIITKVTLNTSPPSISSKNQNHQPSHNKNNGKGKHHQLKCGHRTIVLPSRITECFAKQDDVAIIQNAIVGPSIILELGCGVGLTGLVASAALRANVTVLTDLKEVVEKVTQPNVEQNSVPITASSATTKKFTARHHHHNNANVRTINKGQGRVVAVPLCWGNNEDETYVLELLKELDSSTPSNNSNNNKPRRKKKGSHNTATKHPGSDGVGSTCSHQNEKVHGMPDLIIIGDVAYQHRPGAPSHFDILMSTLLKFTSSSSYDKDNDNNNNKNSNNNAVVVFGTRIRMPASVDLLDMMLQYFEEIVIPPLRADEIDPSFRDVKHNMTIHFLRRKKNINNNNNNNDTVSG